MLGAQDDAIASRLAQILEEAGRDQVIVDAGADVAQSLVCGRCGALVKSSRMEVHMSMWCEALSSEGTKAAQGEAESQKLPSAHLYWARSPTNPDGPATPHQLNSGGGGGPKGGGAAEGVLL